MRSTVRGFTLVELMIALAVLSVLAILAVPSFIDFRQRTALRGAADQISVFWGNARFAALQRDSLVKVGFKSTAGGDYCIGAATTTDENDDTACDCFSAGACNVDSYPSTQSEWRGVRVASNPTIGEGNGSSTDGVVVIDPKRAILTDSADEGRILLSGPANGPRDYRLNVVLDRNGRAVQCEPTAAPSKLPDYGNKRC